MMDYIVEIHSEKGSEIEVTVNANVVYFSGIVKSDIVFSHEVEGERFFVCDVASKRKSGTEDVIPVFVSEKLLKEKEYDYVNIYGEYRQINRNGSVHYIFAKVFEALEIPAEVDLNVVALDGYICKKFPLRSTPVTERTISDFVVAVNRSSGKVSYISCITWGRNAHYVDGLEIGTHIKIAGRLQSRTYTKMIDGKPEERIAYELSATTVEAVNLKCEIDSNMGDEEFIDKLDKEESEDK